MSEATGTTEGEATAHAPTEAADATPVATLAMRDGGIALALLSLWAAADTWHATSGLGFAGLLATADGIVAGAALGILAHEWGHFAGARLGGGVAPTKPLRSLFPIFALDLERSDDRAFRAMSLGGNLGHWLLVVLLAAILPLHTVGPVALLSGAFGFAISASTTEFPIIRRTFAGSSPAESFRGLTRASLRRDRWIGAGAGLALFLVL